MSIRSFVIWCGSHILSYPNCFTGELGHQQCLPYYMETAYTVKVSPNFRWLIDQLNKPKSRQAVSRSLNRSPWRHKNHEKTKWQHLVSTKRNENITSQFSYHITKETKSSSGISYIFIFAYSFLFEVWKSSSHVIHTLQGTTTTSSLNPLPPLPE